MGLDHDNADKNREIERYIENGEFRINGEFKGKHIVSIEQFAAADLHAVFDRTQQIEAVYKEEPRALLARCQARVMVPLFYEASTRTDISFQAAMRRMGGEVVVPSNGIQFSSVYKGENLVDTVRALGNYADVIVCRHPDKGSSYEAAWALQLLKQRDITTSSLISGGDGIGEHPTQALLDAYTIIKYKGNLDGLVITMVGDLRNGRTVHSLSKAIAELGGQRVRITFVSPESLAMPEDIVHMLQTKGVDVYQTQDLSEVIGASDVIYWTRVQQERFKNNPEEYERIKDDFIMTPSVARGMKYSSIFMHPLPRKHEMGTEEDHLILDEDPRFVYNEQMRNGMFVRMALLDLVLNGNAT